MNALLRIAVWMLALGLVALPVVALINGWVGAERWPLRTLRLQGSLQRVDAQQVQQAMLPFAARGYFAVPLDQARAAVEALPWVRSAHVQKRWPDVLEVRIVEYRPFARWGENRLIASDGRIFPMQGTLQEALPQLAGPDARVSEVIALYNQAAELFSGSEHPVQALRMDERGSATVQLDPGIAVVVGGSAARSRLQRFARLLPRLQGEQPRPLRRADLRYTNGFALVWDEVPVSSVPRSARPASASVSPASNRVTAAL